MQKRDRDFLEVIMSIQRPVLPPFDRTGPAHGPRRSAVIPLPQAPIGVNTDDYKTGGLP